jgi:hypothetical protein
MKIKTSLNIRNLLVMIVTLTIMTALQIPKVSIAYNNSQNPPCRWPYTVGVKKTLYYKWGNFVDDDWKAAYNISAVDWTGATNRVGFGYSTSATNTFNMYYSIDGRGGYAVWNCSGTTMTRSDAWVNDYYDTGNNNIRRSTTGHEMGHVASLGHSNVTPALMGGNPDPNIYYVPQQDDKNGVYDRFPW